MSAPRIKLIDEGHYHIYSRFVLGEFLLAERKEIAVWLRCERILAKYAQDGGIGGKMGVSARAVRRLLGVKISRNNGEVD